MFYKMFFTFFIIFGYIFETISEERFSCDGRPPGYYADLKAGCQIYHVCDGLGRQFSYTCPNATLFQQRMLICDHWYMVNCSKSEDDYAANLLIGQKDKPFVEDFEKHFQDRTPRPDLLNKSEIPDLNNIYRRGRTQFTSSFNLVGIETDESNSSSTNLPHYSLPSHWFTEYSKAPVTEKALNYTNRRENKHKFQEPYKKIHNLKNKIKSVANQTTKPLNNSETSYKMFKSPQKEGNTRQPSHTIRDGPETSTRNSVRHDKHSASQSINSDAELSNLKKLYLIPDYEFPLDSVARPTYENGKSSFEVKPTPFEYHKK